MAPDDLFRYDEYVIDPARHTVTCRYATMNTSSPSDSPSRRAATGHDPAVRPPRLLFLVAGVSYYKTTAAPVIDLGDLAPRASSGRS